MYRVPNIIHKPVDEGEGNLWLAYIAISQVKPEECHLCQPDRDAARGPHGGSGFINDHPAEKFYRDAKLCTIGKGTSEIQRLVIARQLLKD